MLVFGLVGHIASGKGTVVEYLKKNHNAIQYRFSKILDDILSRLYLENSRDNQINLAVKLRELHGNDVLARVLASDIKKDNPKLAIVDGIRYKEELEAFRALPDFKLVAVIADEEIRYKRMLLRGEKAGETKTTRKDFTNMHKRPTEIYIDALMQTADVTIANNGSSEELYKQIEGLVTL